jgi:hypothetical protein
MTVDDSPISCVRECAPRLHRRCSPPATVVATPTINVLYIGVPSRYHSLDFIHRARSIPNSLESRTSTLCTHLVVLMHMSSWHAWRTHDAVALQIMLDTVPHESFALQASSQPLHCADARSRTFPIFPTRVTTACRQTSVRLAPSYPTTDVLPYPFSRPVRSLPTGHLCISISCLPQFTNYNRARPASLDVIRAIRLRRIDVLPFTYLVLWRSGKCCERVQISNLPTRYGGARHSPKRPEYCR